MVFTLLPLPNVKAARATRENAVLFSVESRLVGGVPKYFLAVDDVYDGMTYKSFSITYPKELDIVVPQTVTDAWKSSNDADNDAPDKTTITWSFMVKTPSDTKDAATLKAHIASITFGLATANVFPPAESKITITASEDLVTQFVDERGYIHYYEFVSSSGITWSNAYNAAKQKYMTDPRYPDEKLQGYLATITSQAEHNKIYLDIAIQPGWLGGTELVKSSDKSKIQDVGSINIGDYTIVDGAANPPYYYSEWYWLDGPEAWTTYNAATGAVTYYAKGTQGTSPLVFYKSSKYIDETTDAASRPNGIYSNFNNPTNTALIGHPGGDNVSGYQPDSAGGENVLQFHFNNGLYGGECDLWNDLSNGYGGNAGYYVEYGGYPGDPHVSDNNFIGVSVSEVDVVLPIHVEYRSVVVEGDGFRRMTSVGISRDTKLSDGVIGMTYKTVKNMAPITGFTPLGYEFEGLDEDREKLSVVDADGNIAGVFSDEVQKIIFLYQPDIYTVTFDANFVGATNANVSPQTMPVLYDTPYGPLGTATRQGYTFNGKWYTGATDGSEVTATTVVTATGPHTLYARWTEKTGYRVVYDMNGATSAQVPALQSLSWTSKNLTPLTEPTRDGYHFVGWDVSDGGIRRGVYPENSYGFLASNDETMVLTLQAQWLKIPEYPIVIYRVNDSDAVIPDATLEYRSDIVDLPQIIRAGYTFAGWTLAHGKSAALGNVVAEDTEFETLANTDEDFIILETSWSAKTYTVNYHVDDATPAVYETLTGVTWEQNGLVPPPVNGDPEKVGEQLMFWATDNGDMVSTGNTYGSIVTDDTVTTVDLYAQWTAGLTYTVRYDLDGGTANGNSTLAEKYVTLSQANLLPTETITPPIGYTQTGWKVYANGNKLNVTNADTFGGLAANPNLGYITLQAQYAPKSNFTVKYDVNSPSGAGATDPASYSDKTAVMWAQSNLIPNLDPRIAGYTFVGWNTVDDGTGINVTKATPYSQLASNDTDPYITLYAQWTDKAFTVKYDVNGGPTQIANKALDNADDIVELPTPANRIGYNFSRWTLKDNGNYVGTGATVAANTKFSTIAFSGATFIELQAQWTVKTGYTVDYDLGYVGAPAPPTSLENLTWNDTKLLPAANPTRTGYNFLGWTYGGNTYASSVDPYSKLAGNDDNTANHVLLTAQWEPGSFIVYYDYNGGNGTVTSKTGIALGDTNLLPSTAPTRPGYTALGWNVSSNGAGTNVQNTATYGSLAYTGATFITLQAQWGAKSFTVDYNSNGGVGTNPQLTGVFWDSSNLIPVPAQNPTKIGYTFTGWKRAKIDNNDVALSDYVTTATRYSAIADASGAASGVTLFAQWSERGDFVVKYDTSGYTASDPTAVADRQVAWSAANLIPNVTFTNRPSGKQPKWVLSKIGNTAASGADVLSTDKYNELTGGTDAPDITLKVVMVDMTFTVKFDANGGTGGSLPNVPNVLWTSAMPLPSTANYPTMNGYEIAGWKVSSYGDTTVSGEDIANAAFVTPGDTYGAHALSDGYAYITLQAQWVPKSGYSVDYDTNGGSTLLPRHGLNWESNNLPPSAYTTRTGYTLAGWTFNDDPVPPARRYSELALVDTVLSLTLTAQWEAKTGYAVRYDLNGARGDAIPEKTNVSWEDDTLLPDLIPERKNYDFLGWNVSHCGHGTNVQNDATFGQLADSDTVRYIVLQAQWVRSGKYAVSYDTNGATSPVIPSIIVAFDAKGLLPATEPTRTGYAFAGWLVTDDGEGNAPLTPVDNDTTFDTLAANTDVSRITLQAQWTLVTYTVYYDVNGADTGNIPEKAVQWDSVGLAAAVSPTLAGYKFVGWKVSGDAENRTVRPSHAYSDFAVDPDVESITLIATWLDLGKYLVRFEMNGGTPIPEDGEDDIQYYVELDEYDAPLDYAPAVARHGYDFAGWNVVENGYGIDVTTDETYSELAFDENTPYIVLEAEWTPSLFEVQYDTAGGKPEEIDGITVFWVTSGLLPETAPTRRGYTFLGWYTVETRKVSDDDAYAELANDDDEVKVILLEAKWKLTPGGDYPSTGDDEDEETDGPPDLNYDDHYAYLIGYPDETIHPESNITRAEVVTIFFRLLDDSERDALWSKENGFSDVAVGKHWANTAISTLANAEVINGYPDGSFRPDAPMTRAELIAVVARFLKTPTVEGGTAFTDVDGHWAKAYIYAAFEAGIIQGYGDGTFRPDALITRAEVVTIVNNLLGHNPRSVDALLPEMIRWSDNADERKWYYIAIQEATNSHYVADETNGKGEIWSSLRENRDWAELERR
jgi:uncharacterized repeat protein (TIGR02543 family)